MTQEIILRRVSIIKHLYKVGEQQSQLSESVAYSSILLFHDAIDMFNQLVAEYSGKTDKDKKLVTGGRSNPFFMMEYFDLIPQLTLKPSVKKINERRNSLKHNGQIPAKIEIEESKTIAYLFFEQNTQIIFGLDFEKVTLHDLIPYPSVKSFLLSAESCLGSGQLEECIREVAKAFNEIKELNSDYWYRNSKLLGEGNYMGLPLINLGSDKKFYVKFDDWVNPEKLEIPEGVAALMHRLNHRLYALSNSFEAFMFGVDFKEYSYFKMFMPVVAGLYNDGTHIMSPINQVITLTPEKCRFAIDFVSKLSLNYKQFDDIG